MVLDLLPRHPASPISTRATPIIASVRRRHGCCARSSAGPKEKLQVTFQSRFGPEEWLQPYTDKTVEKLGKEGVKRIAVINPGFVSDCLETLEEIAVEAAETFHHAGGEKFAAYPVPQRQPDGMTVLEHVVRRELMGWV